MKKSKFAIVIALGLVLCLLCGVTTTFSWFRRENPPREESGDTLKWSGQYKISNGQNISIKTVESNDDGATFGDNAVTNFSGSLQAGKRRYFCTEISNAGDTEQSVSLFIDQLKFNNASDSLYIGVNSPLKTYKKYSGSASAEGTATTVQNNKMRVYFQHKGVSYWDSGNISVYYSNSSTLDEKSSHIDVNYIGYVGDPQAHTYYVDLPSDTQQIFFKAKDNSSSAFYRTQNQNVKSHGLSTTQSLVYYLTGGNTGSPYYNAAVGSSKVTGANIATSYGSIIVPLNGTFTASLTSGLDYTGTMKYYTGSNSCFSVDENTGVITPKSIGTSKLYMKVTGTFGDSYQLECSVTVTSAKEINQENVPIVTNLEIKPKTLDGPMVSKVYWYIKNESSSTITYTLDDVYISL